MILNKSIDGHVLSFENQYLKFSTREGLSFTMPMTPQDIERLAENLNDMFCLDYQVGKAVGDITLRCMQSAETEDIRMRYLIKGLLSLQNKQQIRGFAGELLPVLSAGLAREVA